MTDNRLDSNYWGAGRPARPSNGGGIRPVGGVTQDPYGNRIQGGDRIQPVPGGSVGKGISPTSKDPSPADTRG